MQDFAQNYIKTERKLFSFLSIFFLSALANKKICCYAAAANYEKVSKYVLSLPPEIIDHIWFSAVTVGAQHFVQIGEEIF